MDGRTKRCTESLSPGTPPSVVVPQSQRTSIICAMDSSYSACGAREMNKRLPTPTLAQPGGATRSRRSSGRHYAMIWRAKHLPGGSRWRIQRMADQESTPGSQASFIWRTTLGQSAKSTDRFGAPRHATSPNFSHAGVYGIPYFRIGVQLLLHRLSVHASRPGWLRIRVET